MGRHLRDLGAKEQGRLKRPRPRDARSAPSFGRARVYTDQTCHAHAMGRPTVPHHDRAVAVSAGYRWRDMPTRPHDRNGVRDRHMAEAQPIVGQPQIYPVPHMI